MKRVYQEPDWLLFSTHRQFAQLKRLREIRSRTRRVGPTPPKYAAQRLNKGRYEVVAPEDLSMLTNVEETLAFFEATGVNDERAEPAATGEPGRRG